MDTYRKEADKNLILLIVSSHASPGPSQTFQAQSAYLVESLSLTSQLSKHKNSYKRIPLCSCFSSNKLSILVSPLWSRVNQPRKPSNSELCLTNKKVLRLLNPQLSWSPQNKYKRKKWAKSRQMKTLIGSTSTACQRMWRESTHLAN